MAFSIVVTIFLISHFIFPSKVNVDLRAGVAENQKLIAIKQGTGNGTVLVSSHQFPKISVQLRMRVGDVLYKDYMKSDKYLVRWLNATDFDLPKAEKMLRTGIKWRLENKIEEEISSRHIRGKPMEAMCFLNGTDYEGSPVATVFGGRWNTRAYLYSGKIKIQTLAFAKCLESIQDSVLQRIAAVGDKLGQKSPVDKAILILDMEGYSLKMHACLNCFSVYAKWGTIFEEYYPGLFKEIIYINAPSIMKPLLQFMKPLISRQTAEAMRVFGPNKTEWKAYLRKIIPENQLSFKYGGTLTV